MQPTNTEFWTRAILFGVAVTSAAITLAFIQLNQIGPRFFWASDVCPQATVTCGVMPLGSIVAGLVGLGVAAASGLVINRLFRNGDSHA